jgi:hypothetical protein
MRLATDYADCADCAELFAVESFEPANPRSTALQAFVDTTAKADEIRIEGADENARVGSLFKMQGDEVPSESFRWCRFAWSQDLS